MNEPSHPVDSIPPPLVAVQPPSGPEDETAYLVISACRLGSLLTAGRKQCVLLVDLDDDRSSLALAALNEAMRQPPVLPLEVELGGQRLLIDSSLWCDLGAALVEIEVLRNGCIEELLPGATSEESAP